MGPDQQRLTEIAAKLYALPPNEFVTARNAQVRQATGRLAQAIKALRRPTLSAWLVNLLAAHRDDELNELLALGDRLRDAQHNLEGHEVRELSARRQELTTSLMGLARDLAAEHGRTVRDDAAWEAETTLRAALADPDLAERVRTGTLERPAGYNGLGLLPTGPAAEHSDTDGESAAGQAAPAPPTDSGTRAKLRVIPGGRSTRQAPSPGRVKQPESGKKAKAKQPGTGKEAKARKAAAARADAERALADAQQRLNEAVAAEQQVTRRIGEIASAFDELRERERRLRGEQAEADRERRRAQRRRTAAEKAVADARRRLRPR